MNCREKEKASNTASGDDNGEEDEDVRRMKEMMGFGSFGANKKK